VEYLQGKGFEVRGADAGEEALRQIPDFRPHVVLLDIAMPRMSGVEALRRIKALPQETCVVMVSGIEDMETAKQTLALGAADYVTKPVDFQYLDSVLEVHLFMDQI
jgi:two-component system OmpR family response regulator